MSRVFILVVLVVISGCNGDDSSSVGNGYCEHPVEISNQEDATTHGFLVELKSDWDVNTVSLSFLEKYEDLEVFTVYSNWNGFYADSSDATLAKLACEPNVAALYYNNAVSVIRR